MSSQHETEDRFFAATWERLGDAIHAVIEAERERGPFAIAAARKRVDFDAASDQWPTDDRLGNLATTTEVLERKHPDSSMKSYSISDHIDCTRGPAALIHEVEALTRRLITRERSSLASLMAPTDVRPLVSGPVPIRDLRAGHSPDDFDLIVNTDAPAGETDAGTGELLAEIAKPLANFLGGKVVLGSLGAGGNHLVVSSNAITIHEAGPVRYGRPCAGRFKIETVLSLAVDPNATLVALHA